MHLFRSEPSSSAVLTKSGVGFAFNMPAWRTARNQSKYHGKAQCLEIQNSSSSLPESFHFLAFER
jgi:hypothetical protein